MIHLYFDLDDTLIKTNEEFLRILKQKHGFIAEAGVYLTPQNTNGHITGILESASFMITAKPCELIVNQLNKLKAIASPEMVTFNICTHRGYHPRAEEYTEVMLKDNSLEFDNRIYLNPYKHPDKMEYLKQQHSDKDTVVLIDDRPHFSTSGQLDKDILLIDMPWNRNMFVPLHQRVVCRKTLYNKTVDLVPEGWF